MCFFNVLTSAVFKIAIPIVNATKQNTDSAQVGCHRTKNSVTPKLRFCKAFYSKDATGIFAQASRADQHHLPYN